MRGLIAALSAALCILATGNASLASDTVCDSHGCIKVSTFSTNIYNKLNKKVVGFAVLVGGWFPYYGGWARTSSDSPKTAMGGELDTNIASVSKVLTTIGVLQSMSAHKIKLDDKIWPYLYPDWRKHA
ncbi:MAG: serine hydrolase, partial [Candidatus Eremiobacteraeota bacterium]|nr:serine hydrolase [Candidatus Eremiobacteraeota bacterium]